MTTVHPAFDPETRTWFVEKPRKAEAPTIRALLTKLGSSFVAEGYRPIGDIEPIVYRQEKLAYGGPMPTRPVSPSVANIGKPKIKKPAPMPAEQIAAIAPAPAAKAEPTIDTSDIPEVGEEWFKKSKFKKKVADKPASKPPRQDAQPVQSNVPVALPTVPMTALPPLGNAPRLSPEQRDRLARQQEADRLRAYHAERQRAFRERKKTTGPPGRDPPHPAPEREATPAERLRFNTQENAILDAWAAGENGVAIALRFGLTHARVAANLVPKARLLGDPRAVVRAPKKIGVRMPMRARGHGW